MGNVIDELILTCEHATNHVPVAYRPLFRGRRKLLEGHLGYDVGALSIAEAFSRAFGAKLHVGSASRLLVDLNRSPDNPARFSPIVCSQDAASRQRIAESLYFPYRPRIEDELGRLARRSKRVLHLSVHTFTPLWRGKAREADVGLLYAPRRPAERRLCGDWKHEILRLEPGLRVRRNYPYRGTSDGLTSYLRKRLPAARYLGVELEVSQELAGRASPSWRKARTHLIEALRPLLRSR